ncbi:helix-turn-helix domain-containing protein [Pseudonocardia sp. CA-142604]|uniref:helix-turn-helix domain-containing protein n=1 Tax=Pseudonocardia sp. CA-142604 TaxID=3240024 RepID=UPI003D94001F
MAVKINEFSSEEYEQTVRECLFPVIARTGPDFRGRLALQELSETVALTRAHWGGPMRAARTDRMTTRTSTDHLILFCLYLGGNGHVHQHDRLASLAPSSGVMSETRSPWEVVTPSRTQVLSMLFFREMLPLRASEITEACARRVDPELPGMHLLSGYLGRLWEVADDLTASQRLDAGRAAIDLLAMTMRDVAPSVPGGEGSAGVLLDMMQAHVRDHLADPHLRVEELARRHHVSVSRAYALFERIGTTPGAYLREQRLLAARGMLSDPRRARLPISRIAVAVGFLDLSTFERAFRRQYGMTPAAWRREHLRPGPLQ